MEAEAVVEALEAEAHEVLGGARDEVAVHLDVEVPQARLQLHIALLPQLWGGVGCAVGWDVYVCVSV